jgi:antitoxin (DNA-binding transcriptional repressor) of toxin-antitoxin stability system
MRQANVRDLHLKTGAIVREVLEGEIFIILKRGTPVAELRPIAALPSARRLPNREAFIARLPRVTTDSGRILEEDRS